MNVFPGHGDSLLRGLDVLVDGTTIRSIRQHGEDARWGGDDEVIDGAGKTLMPGLIDAHYHAAITGMPIGGQLMPDLNYSMIDAGRQATATLIRGFTTVRDCGGPTFGLKRAIDDGLVAGPRIYPAGAMITQTSGHADFRSSTEISPCCSGVAHVERIGLSVIADGVDAVLKASREQLRLGASHLKLMAGGGISSAYDPLDVVQYTEAELRAGVDAAENWGTYVMVHAYTPRSVQQALRAGVRSIEHGHLVDEATVQQMAEAGAWWSLQPFLGEEQSEGLPPASLAKLSEVVKGTHRSYELAIKHRIKVAWGSDIMASDGFAPRQLSMLMAMTRWYSPAEVLAMATSANGELLQLSGARNPYPGVLGRVEEGAIADLLLVDGDPLAQLSLLGDPEQNLAAIMKDGVLVKRRC
ncbi:MAG: amidohydrolase family protein [Ilumatobacteraceae bacterium]